ncbi:DUF1850 domain-containing protein [Moraxella canis]|uniref:DUF1850 domain-containing protein n=1 Tax=Moraxella canis TaxID=90239 RepID=A0ABZ0X051_9GAMM|nr:DUF1850 domain-containing protein [Moraxella canis]WQE04841.1 DUF1850 domain-containing protein [Moraxella canis]
MLKLNSVSTPWIWLILLVLATLLIIYLNKSEQAIRIQGGDIDCQWSEPDFTLKWRHSVEKQYWQEYYHMDGTQLRLTKTFIQTFGAGTPSVGAVIPAPEGYIGLSSDVLLLKIHWVVSRNMQGTILGQHGSLPIYERVADYTEIQISSEEHPKWFWLIKESCHDRHAHTKHSS